MKIIVVNGSPCKLWNITRLLEKTLEGAASTGSETKLVQQFTISETGSFTSETGRLAVKSTTDNYS